MADILNLINSLFVVAEAFIHPKLFFKTIPQLAILGGWHFYAGVNITRGAKKMPIRIRQLVKS